MSRPKSVVLKNFPQYNLLHTYKAKMYSGVTLTALLPMKETAQYYRSINVWSPVSSSLKGKKNNLKLSVDIPVVTDSSSVDVLENNYWKDYLEKHADSSDLKEAIALLKKLFPNKTPKYFYELDSLIFAYTNGTFERFNRDGSPDTLSSHNIEQQQYYNEKYSPLKHDATVIKWSKELHESKPTTEDYTAHFNKVRNYLFENGNVVTQLLNIAKNSVCYSVAFTDGTADWYKKEYGHVCPYAHAGEIYFTVTEDSVYFNISRHF